MQNQNLQLSLIKQNANATNIAQTHLCKNRHIINGLVGTLKRVKI